MNNWDFFKRVVERMDGYACFLVVWMWIEKVVLGMKFIFVIFSF